MRMKATSAAGGRYFQAVEPLNNLMRGAYGILGAVLGGAQATFIAGYDEAFALPNEESALLGLRTLQILQEETDVTRTIDPLGGSYYVEALTDRIEADARAFMAKIDERGGVVRGIEDGWIRAQLDACLYDQISRMRDGRINLVGVNKHRREGVREEQMTLHRHDASVAVRQAKRLDEVRKSRSPAAVERTLNALRAGAESDANLLPLMIDCARELVTVGEMARVLIDIYGRFGDPNVRNI
jgi:methylmalonyl-CoA mutase N-terminal domain/subunit